MMDQFSAFEKSMHRRTGVDLEEDESIIVYPFDNYRIEVRLDCNGKFLGITGISIEKEFLSFMQKMQKIRSMGYLDLSKKYPEETDEDDL